MSIYIFIITYMHRYIHIYVSISISISVSISISIAFGVCARAFFAFSARLPANHVLSAPSQTGVLILRRNQAKICGESVAR